MLFGRFARQQSFFRSLFEPVSASGNAGNPAIENYVDSPVHVEFLDSKKVVFSSTSATKTFRRGPRRKSRSAATVSLHSNWRTALAAKRPNHRRRFTRDQDQKEQHGVEACELLERRSCIVPCIVPG